MGWRISRINHELKKYDQRLFACQNPGGAIVVLREPDRLAASDHHQEMSDASTLHTQFILALTDNWKLTGKAVEMGLEPLMTRIRELDGWRDDTIPDQMRRGREQEKETKEQSRRNDFRARAADLRKEFAEATNDINTSNLDMTDQRRMKNGTCK